MGPSYFDLFYRDIHQNLQLEASLLYLFAVRAQTAWETESKRVESVYY